MLDRLPPTARLWLFAFDRPFVPAALLADVEAFCETWTSHGRPVPATAEVLEPGVLAVAAQLSDAEVNRQVGAANAGVSGCGIDAMQRAVEAAAERHGRTLADPLSVVVFAGEWQSASRPAFRRLVQGGQVSGETEVLDLTPTTLGALREAGGVARPAGETWHRVAFRIPVAA